MNRKLIALICFFCIFIMISTTTVVSKVNSNSFMDKIEGKNKLITKLKLQIDSNKFLKEKTFFNTNFLKSSLNNSQNNYNTSFLIRIIRVILAFILLIPSVIPQIIAFVVETYILLPLLPIYILFRELPHFLRIFWFTLLLWIPGVTCLLVIDNQGEIDIIEIFVQLFYMWNDIMTLLNLF